MFLLSAALFLAMAAAQPVYAQTTIRVGIYQNPPKIFIAPDGRPDGMYIDVLNGITKAANLKVEFVKCVWLECLELLEEGRIEVMPDVAHSLERAQRFQFSRIPVFHGWSVVYVHDRSSIKTLIDLDQKRVAVLAGGAQEADMRKIAAEFGIKPQLIQYDSFDDMFAHLRDEKVDAALFNRFIGAWRARDFGVHATPVIFAPSTNFFAYSKKLAPSTSQLIDNTLQGLVETAGSEYDVALKKWFYDYHPPAVPTWAYWTVAVAAALLAISMSFVWLLRRTVRSRTAELRDRLAEMQRKDEQLVQSQKMEAVGQLTGGIAHDFNNLLTVIMGNAELLVEALASDSKIRPLAEMVGKAAQRGADLTASLLAFSRKQMLEPKVTDINRLVTRMDGLLRRALGEHVEIEFVSGKGLLPATVDVARLESAIVNLAVNARDAMPEGGKLTIETANAELDEDYARRNEGAGPGLYVMIAVTDTGTGMAPEVAARAFDPFFTTKDIGKGTGLGLSMVYGLIKQSGGYIKLYSEVGHGTTVKLYLPRSAEADAPPPVPAAPAEAHGGGRTVLMVEDDDMVRAHVESQIASLGYRVLSARNGAEALEALQQNERVDLLFTDVVMPGAMNGLRLAEAAQRLRPGLKVLYTSGYTDNAIVHQGKLDPGIDLLSKPYRRYDLAAKLRDVLDGAGTR